MPHTLCIVDFHTETPVDIIKNKMDQLCFMSDPYVLNIKQRINDFLSPVLLSGKTIGDMQVRHISYRCAGLNLLITHLLPLLEDEEEIFLRNNIIYVLKENWQNIFKGTPVIQRSTNHANYYFFSPHIHFCNESSRISIDEDFSFKENFVLSPINLMSEKNSLYFDMVQGMHLVMLEAGHGYGFNQLLAFRYPLIPRYLSSQNIKNDVALNFVLCNQPLCFRSIQSKKFFELYKKILLFHKIDEGSFLSLCKLSELLNKFAHDSILQFQGHKNLDILEVLCFFGGNLALLKDLLVYAEIVNHSLYEKIYARWTEENLIYTNFLSNCVIQKIFSAIEVKCNAFFIENLFLKHKDFFDKKVKKFHSQFLNFYTAESKQFSRKQHYDQEYFLKILKNNFNENN